MSVWRCDIDHNHDHAKGGETCERNLAHLCKHHHVLKTDTEWNVHNLGGGKLRWTSPTGRTYTDTPDPVLRFTPDTPDTPDNPDDAEHTDANIDSDVDLDLDLDLDVDVDVDEPPWTTAT